MRDSKTPVRAFVRWLWLIVSGTVLAAEAPFAQDAAPLTAGADVVLLTGLPGDVESETAFASQLERLLEILVRPRARPRRVVVLNDAGAAGADPPGLDLSVRRGDRGSFLAVADELAGSEAPLVVFVWGHGGLMGSEPVFHVRGPRLEPADFRALAERIAGPSRWVLLFPHSGAFARALRAPGREILSSENATAFRSTPVAPVLVLEILRDTPVISLTGLAERLGAATRSWYEEQHLARQEEPTLWLGEALPRQVAGGGSRIAAAEGGAGAAGEGEDVDAEEEPETTGGSSAWQGLERVAANRYPDAAAVVLRRLSSYVLAENPALEHESDEIVQILTPEGSVHGDFDIAYHPPGEKITFLDLEVLRPDGTVVRLPPGEIRDATPEALPEYRPATRKVFSLPHATPGSVLRVHFVREWRRFPLPHVPLEIPLAGDLPVVDQEIEIRVAREAPLHYAFHAHAARDPEVRETPYGRSLTWKLADLPPVAREALSHPRRTPALLVSTFPSWEGFADWYERLIRLADQATPEIAAKATELTANARTEREQVAAIYDFVTGLRYVAIPFGVNSHRPHAAANVFANRYGDCKDKANLFNTMLAAVGIEADLVLVPRFAQAYEETPGLGFNHAISRVRLGDEVIWADTTDADARFGLLPPGDPGRNVLVIHEGSTGLTALPDPEPSDHRLTFRAEIRLAADGRTAPAELRVETAGFPDYELRSLARATGSPSATLPVLFAALEPANGYFAMTRQSTTPAAALDRDFAWRAEGRWTGLTVPLSGEVLVRAPFLLPAEWREALHERSTPLYLNRGYPLTLAQEIVFVLPGGGEVRRLPAPMESRRGPLEWRVEWKLAEARLEARLEVVLEKGELDPDETTAFREELERLYEALGRGAVAVLRSDATLGARGNRKAYLSSAT
jgi:transglutaminase-like putative cysteine protease